MVTDCPRCGAKKATFDVLGQRKLVGSEDCPGGSSDPDTLWEVYSICRTCDDATALVAHPRGMEALPPGVGILSPKEVPHQYEVVTVADIYTPAGSPPPKHLPSEIDTAFKEGAKCLAVGCPNAAASMLRLCLELAVNPLLPPEVSARRLTLRRKLDWCLDNGKLPEKLRDLSKAVREDGNEAAHGGTVDMTKARDQEDFTIEILTERFTRPEEIRLKLKARETRKAEEESRRSSSSARGPQ